VVGVVNTANGQTSYHLALNTGTYTVIPGRAWSVNNCREIAGTLPADGDDRDGYYLGSLDAGAIALPPLADDSWVDVYCINDSRLIIGTSKLVVDGEQIGFRTAVVWRAIVNENETVTIDGPVPLFPLEGDPSSSAIDINDPVAGGPFEILGRSGSQAVLWTIGLDSDGRLSLPSEPRSLGNLDGRPFDGYAINSLGDCCGSAGSSPVFKPLEGPILPLNVVRNTSFGSSMDINDLGLMVGQIDTVSKSNSYSYGAYLWEGLDADPVDLEKLIDKESGWDLYYADHINSSGVIAGSGFYNGDPAGLGFIMIRNP
jgi:hypothetical protein